MATTDIVLATINAKYIHSAFGLRCLAANLGELAARAEVLEFTGRQSTSDIAEAILLRKPRILGLGVYIWNAVQSAELVALLSRVAPDMDIVLGGPEVSYEHEQQAIVRDADFLITGEGELAFRTLCERLLSGRRPLQGVIAGGVPPIEELSFAYSLYDEEDLAHRVLYVEASRGCPYRCEFCLSSLDAKVRAFPLEPFLAQMQDLLDRGARQFKFVDRTFNLDLARSRAILDFFLERLRPGLFLHFELVPDRLPESLREIIARFPEGTLQFEVGIQTLDDEVGARISRRQNLDKTFANLEYLRTQTGVHLHTDLIVGLPGESIEQFGDGLDRLFASEVQEIQVGILKRLRGTPISRHDTEFGMVYRDVAPYDVLRTSTLDFETLQRLKRFAQVWNRVVNEGNFRGTVGLVWEGQSPFWSVLEFSDWLADWAGRVHAISLENLARYLLTFLVSRRGMNEEEVATRLRADFERTKRKVPRRLNCVPRMEDRPVRASSAAAPARQARHQD